MKLPPKITITDHFSTLKDPRIERSKLHQLIDIITIAICAVICGADGWEQIELYGKAKHKWFQQFLALPNGIPSHDTFARVFARIDPEEFQQCFIDWIKAISKLTNGEVIAIDGKTLCHSYDTASSQSAIHMVSAWATANRLVLGQVKVNDKSNEITAIPELLRVLEVAGCIVTIDAMGCQKDIAKLIIERQADYILTVKQNQGYLYKDIEQLFKQAQKNQFQGIDHSYYETINKNHGRLEIRRCWLLSNVADLIDTDSNWSNFFSVGVVESERRIKEKIEQETRYYISSIQHQNAKLFGQAVRSHWEVENRLHWVLDVTFNEDNCRIRSDNAPQNFAVIRHIAVNKSKSGKKSKIKSK
ncbi:transposase IS4 family protein [Crinalium epipsammum PCC 9333]|uniref:Transposase IS4 family protein n=1 Tax=Crinalium epipsammum PCC 9333 TaxID=1173022 RepID=K9VVE8_9CYAN|nr:transposase IS4 family protein [Crinalium epipsammum PCC 9333]